MGSVEDPDFAKQNDRDSAARPLADIPTKLLKQGLDVPPRQASASSVYGTTAQNQQQPLVSGFLDTDNAGPEWQAECYCYRSRLDGGLSTPGACSKVSHLHRQRLRSFASPAELKSTPPHFSHWRSTSDPGP